MKQARTPTFFRELGVPDTPEGRFEIIALHACLLLRRLRVEGTDGQALGQELFDLMFADFDHSLRELGVGDLSVGKYVKRLAGNFYARLAALDAGLAARDPHALQPMLQTNVYHGGREPSAIQLAALAGYLVELDKVLTAHDMRALQAGAIAWIAPPTPSQQPTNVRPT